MGYRTYPVYTGHARREGKDQEEAPQEERGTHRLGIRIVFEPPTGKVHCRARERSEEQARPRTQCGQDKHGDVQHQQITE